MNRRFSYSIPVATGDALVAGDIDPVRLGRIEDAPLPGSGLGITGDVDVYDVPGEAFLLRYGTDEDDDGRRYIFTDSDGLDELADEIADGNADIIELRNGPLEERLEDRFFVVDEQGVEQ